MFEVRNTNDIHNILLVPVIFQSKNGRMMTKATIEFFDYVAGTRLSEVVTLNSSVNQRVACISFAQLAKYAEKESVSHLSDLLDSVVHQSDLYSDSLHSCKISFSNDSGDSESTLYYFVIPAVSPSSAISSKLEIDIKGVSMTLSAFVNEVDMVSFDVFVVLRCKYSDVLLSRNTITDRTNFFQQQKFIGNYDITEILAFAVASFTNGQKRLVAYDTLNSGMILTPSYTINTKPIVYNATDNTKTMGVMLKIEALVFDGLNTKDYGNLFYRNGLKIAVNEKASIMFNRLMGLEA